MSEETGVPDYVSREEFNRNYAYKVMLLLAGLVMTVMYIEGMLTPSLPTIEGDFTITAAQASLILSMYMVGGVAATPVVGKLGDIYGKKRVLVVILSVYAVAVTITGFSPNFTFMIVSRTVQGVGMAVMPLGFALVREEFPKDMIPKAQAVVSAMFGAGFAVSLPLGSWVSNYYGWRWTYHSAIPVVVILAILAFVMIKESRFRRPEVKIDYLGATLLAVTLSLFVFALSEGSNWGWLSTNTLSLIFTGFVLAIPLAWYELRYTRLGGEAILNFKLLSVRNVLVANLILTIAGIGMFLSMFALTYRFQYQFFENSSNRILDTGLALVPFALGTIIFGPIGGVLVSRTGVKPISIAGAVITALGFFLQATLPAYWGVLSFEFLTGAGLSLINGTLINLIVLTVNPKDMGLATAMNGTFRSLGSSIGAPVAGSLISTYSTTVIVGTHIMSIPDNNAFIYTFIAAAAIFLLAALLIPFGREVLGRRKVQPQVPASSAQVDWGTNPNEAS